MADPDPSLWPLERLRAAVPQLGYAYRGLVPGGGRTSRHTPGWCSCWLVDRGWAAVRFEDGREARAGVGEWLLCPPLLPRYQIFPPEAEILSLSFHLPLPPGIDLHRHLPLVRPAERDDPLRAPAERVVAALGGYTVGGSIRYRRPALALDDWFEALRHLTAFVAAWHQAVLGGHSEPANELDGRVRDALQVLATNPRMGSVPYDALGERTGLGRVQLDRLFRQHLGRSPKQALDRLCLERVLRRLDDPTRLIKAIATELGFTDSSHLCRWFARHTGLSPQRYRREGAV